MAIEGVTRIRVADVRDLGGSWLVYLEVDVAPGENNAVMAGLLRQAAYAYTNSAQVEFSVILFDGQSAPIDWMWDNDTDSWRQTPLSATPTN